MNNEDGVPVSTFPRLHESGRRGFFVQGRSTCAGLALVFPNNPTDGKDIPAAACNTRNAMFTSVGPEQFNALGSEQRCCADELTT